MTFGRFSDLSECITDGRWLEGFETLPAGRSGVVSLGRRWTSRALRRRCEGRLRTDGPHHGSSFQRTGSCAGTPGAGCGFALVPSHEPAGRPRLEADEDGHGGDEQPRGAQRAEEDPGGDGEADLAQRGRDHHTAKLPARKTPASSADGPAVRSATDAASRAVRPAPRRGRSGYRGGDHPRVARAIRRDRVGDGMSVDDDEFERRLAQAGDRPSGGVRDFAVDELVTEVAEQLATVRELVAQQGLHLARREARWRGIDRERARRYADLDHLASLLLGWLLERADGADEVEQVSRAEAALADRSDGLGAEFHAVASAWVNGTLNDDDFAKRRNRPRAKLPAALGDFASVDPTAASSEEPVRRERPQGRPPKLLAVDLGAAADEALSPEAFWKAYRAWAKLPVAPAKSDLELEEELFLFQWSDERGRMAVSFVRQWAWNDADGYVAMQQLRAQTTLDWPDGWEGSQDAALWSGEDVEEWFADVAASGGMNAFLRSPSPARLTIEFEWV